MTEFTLKLADTVIAAKVSYKSTEEFCSEYICNEPSEIRLVVSPEDIAFERRLAESNDGSGFSDAYLERQALYRKIAEALVNRNVILFHGSAIETEGNAYIFTAPSGTGKSTHARLWREVYGDRVRMVNDDKPLIRINDGIPVVFGTPWSGKHGLARNVNVPVKGVCLLNRGEENSIGEISGPEAFSVLLQQTYRPSELTLAAKVVELAAAMAEKVECWRMYCNMEPSAAEMSFSAMVEGSR